MNLGALRTRTRYLTSTDAATYTDADLGINLNLAYRKVVGWILEAYDRWVFQKQEAVAHLAAGQRNYQFPTDLITIRGMEVNLSGSVGGFVPATPITLREIQNIGISQNNPDFDNHFSTGAPRYCVGRGSFDLYPRPTANVTNGIRIYYTEEIAELTAITDRPRFLTDYHDILAWMAAEDFFFKNGISAKQVWAASEVEATRIDLMKAYQLKTTNKTPQVRVRVQNYE